MLNKVPLTRVARGPLSLFTCLRSCLCFKSLSNFKSHFLLIPLQMYFIKKKKEEKKWDHQICAPMSLQADTGSPTKMKSNTRPLVPHTLLLELVCCLSVVLFFQAQLENIESSQSTGDKTQFAQSRFPSAKWASYTQVERDATSNWRPWR